MCTINNDYQSSLANNDNLFEEQPVVTKTVGIVKEFKYNWKYFNCGKKNYNYTSLLSSDDDDS